ncbi:hypothetical protein GGR53DRAFT_502378 [Hypoxylon sp. FL1150]|nr:hypothetical protein GGR53DRAFT_502378 [Hypoxylon sp. FL1150]
MEAFRLRGEKLYRIEIPLTEVQYGMRAGFPEDRAMDLRGPGSELILLSPFDWACLEEDIFEVLNSYKLSTLVTSKTNMQWSSPM